MSERPRSILKRRKDRSRLVSTLDLYVHDAKGVRYSFEGRGAFYVRCYLWEDAAALVDNSGLPPDTKAGWCCAGLLEEVQTGRWFPVPRPLLGELHFRRHGWNVYVVAHEVTHAVNHRLRALPIGDVPFPVPRREGPGWLRVMRDGAEEWQGYGDPSANCFDEGGAEEEHCHLVGAWTSDVFDWLWENDPHGVNAD